MHPRNPYNGNPPDFDVLARHDPDFAQHVHHASSGKAYINFQDAKAVRSLTRALLARDFHLDVHLPEDRLCPTVANRLDYLLWIQDLLSHHTIGQPVAGIDIGTGASAIYPLLALRLMPSISMVASDIDLVSLASARANIDRNALSGQIHLVQSDKNGPIFGQNILLACEQFDFTMCNPPFYASQEEITTSAELKEDLPSAICTGAEVEMITEGGEASFVLKMIGESKSIQNVRWFTSLLGKHSSLATIVQSFKQHEITNFAVAELQQAQTRRWVVAWSHDALRLPDSFTQSTLPSLAKFHPKPNTLTISVATLLSPEIVLQRLTLALQEVQVKVQAGHDDHLTIEAFGEITWTRQAKRKKVQAALPSASNLLLRCSLSCRAMDSGVEITLVWQEGKDRTAVESLWNHITRNVALT